MYHPPSFILVGINFQPEPTGNAPYTTDLAVALGAKYETKVITGVPHYPWWKKQKNYDDKPYLKNNSGLDLVRVNHYVPNKQSNIGRFVMEASFGLGVLLRDNLRAPVIVLVSPAMISSAIVLGWLKILRRKSTTALWVQDLYEQGLKETSSVSGVGSKLISRIENWLLRSVDQVVFAHEAFAEAKSDLVRSAVSVTSIPNWSQFQYLPTQTSESVRERYGVGSRRLLLHIGNMGLKQGLENVVEAAKKAEQQKQEVMFLLVGSGNQIDYLKDLASDCQSIIFVPPVTEEELSNLLNAADILLVNEKPGVREMSMPSKLTTYFQTGVPVLVSSEPDSIAAREVKSHEIGFWVKSGSPDNLLKAVMELDLERAKSVGASAQEFAKSNLGKSRATQTFVTLLEKLKQSGEEND